MASKIKEFYHRYLYSDELALEVRLVNLVYVVGSMTALAATVFRALVFSSLSLTLVMVTCTVIPIILIYVSNRTKRYRLLNWITVVAFADVLFPLSFFFVGGVDGGMAAYFVLSVVAIFILTKGRQFAVMLITHVACMIGCYYLSFRYPNLTAAFTARQQ
ncbi:MAG: hypothetical protein LBU58_12310 [Clostridiales bacterium]|nr:hypothetical protein [Clostridiales bacterium]